MFRSKEPFNRDYLYELINQENWVDLYWFINDDKAVNITEEDLRLIFSVFPEKYKLRNLRNYENRFTVDFIREFVDRFDDDVFECVKPKQKNSKVMEEFTQYCPYSEFKMKHNKSFTNALKYPHDMTYIKKNVHRFDYYRIFNVFGHREKFNLPEEERQFLIDHAREANCGLKFE